MDTTNRANRNLSVITPEVVEMASKDSLQALYGIISDYLVFQNDK